MHGDREAFGALASLSLPRLVGTAGLILGNRDVAQDAAQDALVRAWRDLPRLRDPDRFDGWLYRILVRACHDQRRRRGDRMPGLQSHIGAVYAAPDPAISVTERAAVAAGLARLTPDQRVVLVLRYYLDLPLDAIAEAIGAPAGTVKSRLHRALNAMEAALAAEARATAQQEGTA